MQNDTHSPKSKKETAGSTDHLSLEDIVHITNKVGMEYVAAKKDFDRLDLMKPTMRARFMLKHEAEGLTEAKIRRLAETDPEYIEYVQKLAEAKSEFEKLKMRYDSYKNLFDARRSMLSYQKAEMKLL